jgi:sterol desaturase/sphingolipid hydroxylase (fatty acid hydroxylase superfamily)
MIPTAIIIFATILFFVAERIFPGRELPEAPGWYARAALLNLAQLGVVLLAGVAWNRWLQGSSLFHISNGMPAFLQGLLGWFVGTFLFYWWHRARHHFDLFWRVFHQVHHSPARLELLTSFYKHPVEIIADSILASTLMFCLVGLRRKRRLGSMPMRLSASTSTTATCELLIGLATFYSARNTTLSITNSMSTNSIMVTSPGGIAFLGHPRHG